MGNLTPEKFDELRDKIVEILKEAGVNWLDAPKICASALNTLGADKNTVYAIRAIPSVFVEALYENP